MYLVTRNDSEIIHTVVDSWNKLPAHVAEAESSSSCI